MKNRSLLTVVLSSIFFRQAARKAVHYVGSSKSLLQLIQQVAVKTSALGLEGSYATAKDHINLLVRMIRAYAKGEYRAIPTKTLGRLVAVLIYFVSPIDLLPDILPFLGLTDDVALILWLVTSISGDIEKFNQWERDRKTVKIG